MEPLTVFSAAEQVAAHLRRELLRGNLTGSMPGVNPLAAELGVNRKTVESALEQLKAEGLLVGQGRGRSCRVKLPKDHAPPSLRIAILDYDPPSRREDYMIDLEHRLSEAGHRVLHPAKTLVELGMDVPKIRALVAECEVDAWIVSAASSGVLEWFSAQTTRAFALFGRLEGLPIAGAKPDKAPAVADATRKLIALGHRRITLLTSGARRLPVPGPSERAFLEELESHGIRTGAYNLPDWELRIEGFHHVLDSLFGSTPPTALIIDEAPFLIGAQQFLGNRGLRVPRDVSLICTDGDPNFSWCRPSIAHIRWDSRPVVRRIVRWANNVAHGAHDRRQSFTKADFTEGGTIGPVPTG